MSNDGGPFKGDRHQGVDYFDDIMSDNTIPAIFDTDFGGGGMRDYEKVDVKTAPSGVKVQMHCRACPMPAEIEMEWPELFVVAMAPQTGILPDGWRRSDANATAYPDLKCNCGATCAPQISPDWAQKQVDAALRGKLIDKSVLMRDQRVQQVMQALQQQAQQQQQHPQFQGR